MDQNITTILLIVAGLVLVAVLYKFFVRTRSTDGTDSRNWVNDSNYNVAAGKSETEAIKTATPAEAKHIADVETQAGAVPPSEEEFYDVQKKIKDSSSDAS